MSRPLLASWLRLSLSQKIGSLWLKTHSDWFTLSANPFIINPAICLTSQKIRKLVHFGRIPIQIGSLWPQTHSPLETSALLSVSYHTIDIDITLKFEILRVTGKQFRNRIYRKCVWSVFMLFAAQFLVKMWKSWFRLPQISSSCIFCIQMANFIQNFVQYFLENLWLKHVKKDS